MHEFYVTQQIIAIACEEAGKQQAKTIDKIHLVVGELTGIIDESVRFYFPLLAENTIAAQADLIIKTVPAKLYCPVCAKHFNKTFDYACPNCSRKGVLTEQGREFYIESIEVDV